MSQIDVAVRRHVVSQASQAGGRMTLARLAAIGHDLVITSAHYGARPSHAEWQGRPCCVSGPKLVGGVQYPGLVQLTGYGGVGGLKGVNCRHSIGPYYPGVTELPDLSFPRESGHFGMTSEECYEAMQRQRELERRVRGTKREIAAMEQAGIGLETPRYAQKRLLHGRQQQALRKHCEESGLVRNYPREKAYGVGAQPRALRAAAKAKAAGRYRHPASQERIDALTSGALAGVRFSAPPTYNGRIRTPGLTKVGYDGDGRKYAGPVYIGKQAKPGDAELVDTILHEELEARIRLNRHGSERYWRLNSAGDDVRHAYIQKIIDRYVRMKAYHEQDRGHIRRSARRDESADRRAGRMRRIVPLLHGERYVHRLARARRDQGAQAVRPAGLHEVARVRARVLGEPASAGFFAAKKIRIYIL